MPGRADQHSGEEPPSDGADDRLAEALAAVEGAYEVVEELHAATADLRALLQDQGAEVERLRRENDDLRREMEALRATKLFRYTSSLRAAYGARRPPG